MIRDAINKVIAGADLTREEASGVMNQIMSGEATDAQIGAFLVALRLKGESVEEITGCASVMREKAIKIATEHGIVVDTCGTGGDGSGTFNISTTAAFVTAGAGLCVAKHGNRAASSKCGSADVLKELGVNVEAPPEKVEECLDEVGIGFLFAPALHKAMKYAIGPRREIGVRTIFNILGPLTNPAGATRQVVGVYDSNLTDIIAQVLGNLGAEHALVVHGMDGLDEITITDRTKVSEFRDGALESYEIVPEDFGFWRAKTEDLLGGEVHENARIVTDVLSGTKGPTRDIVLMNAGAAILVGGLTDSLGEGMRLAAEAIDSGKAMEKLEELTSVSNS